MIHRLDGPDFMPDQRIIAPPQRVLRLVHRVQQPRDIRSEVRSVARDQPALIFRAGILAAPAEEFIKDDQR
jgi:hypothetical protein